MNQQLKVMIVSGLQITPEGAVALSQRASSLRLKAAKQASQSLWRTMTNWVPSPAAGRLGGADETNSSGLIAQCNSAVSGS
jgi:hypothetical protein